MIFSRQSNTALSGRQQTGQPERGDVVDIREDDNFHWGNAVMGPSALGWWQVVIVPNAGWKQLGGLLTGSNDDVSMGSLSWRHRIWSVDLDAIGVGQIPGGIWVVPYEKFIASASVKPQAIVSNEIGFAPNVIG